MPKCEHAQNRRENNPLHREGFAYLEPSEAESSDRHRPHGSLQVNGPVWLGRLALWAGISPTMTAFHWGLGGHSGLHAPEDTGHQRFPPTQSLSQSCCSWRRVCRDSHFSWPCLLTWSKCPHHRRDPAAPPVYICVHTCAHFPPKLCSSSNTPYSQTSLSTRFRWAYCSYLWNQPTVSGKHHLRRQWQTCQSCDPITHRHRARGCA